MSKIIQYYLNRVINTKKTWNSTGDEETQRKEFQTDNNIATVILNSSPFVI